MLTKYVIIHTYRSLKGSQYYVINNMEGTVIVRVSANTGKIITKISLCIA